MWQLIELIAHTPFNKVFSNRMGWDLAHGGFIHSVLILVLEPIMHCLDFALLGRWDCPNFFAYDES